MFNINHISFLRTKKVPCERVKYFFNPGLSQIEKTDDLQSIADPIRFFRMQDDRLQWWKSSKIVWRQFWLRVWRADSASDAFGKSAAVYGQIDKNGHFVRNWPAPKMAITDKMVKNSHLSVKIQTFLTRFYGQMLQKEASVRKSSS